MICPSLNFLQYNGAVIKIKVNEWIIIKKKSGVALTQLSLTCIIVEEYFINSITFLFNLYFICFVVELPACIIIVYNFLT